jgi:hypothetical protein
MLWRHPDHAQARVRLAYCLNLHPAEDLEELLAECARHARLRERLAGAGEVFGAGMYLSAALRIDSRRMRRARAGGALRVPRREGARSLHLQRVPGGRLHDAAQGGRLPADVMEEERASRSTSRPSPRASPPGLSAERRAFTRLDQHAHGRPRVQVRGAADVAACRENRARGPRARVARGEGRTRIVPRSSRSRAPSPRTHASSRASSSG